MTKSDFIKKWLANELSKEEMEAFRKTDDFKSIVRIDNALKSFKSTDYKLEEALTDLTEMRSLIGTERSWIRHLMKVAASVILIVSIAYLFMPAILDQNIKVISKANEPFYLPDSSKVILNKGSLLTYDLSDWQNERTIELSGEGYFEVKKGATFRVMTAQGNVLVLGTAFNVVARESYFVVDCYHGKVSVAIGEKETILTVNERIRAINSISSIVETFQSDDPSWIGGESSFVSAPISRVLEEFERQYNVQLDAYQLDTNLVFTGNFVHTDLNLALKSITVPLELDYKINGSEVTLFRESSN
ncbi:MAG: ferric-dicitrate binding protein FerR (iron transport regulator) [Cyclobacteriaceae bacterium]|jgi:transmembrane sensor